MNFGIFKFLFFSVRKPNGVECASGQLQLLTGNIFQVIYGSRRHIQDKLLTSDGYVYNLRFPGYRWKFTEGGD